MESLYLVGLSVLAVFAFVLAIILFNFFGLWLRARIANAPVSLGKMVGMRLRKVPVGLIVDNRITVVKAGLDVRSDLRPYRILQGSIRERDRLESHQRFDRVVAAAPRNRRTCAPRSPRRSEVRLTPERQYRAFPGVLGNGMASRTLDRPVQ